MHTCLETRQKIFFHVKLSKSKPPKAMDAHPMCGSSPCIPSKTQWPEIYCFHGHLTAATRLFFTFYILGGRTASVLCVFVLPQSKALTQILSLTCFIVLLRWRKPLMSELSSSCLAEAFCFMGSII